MRSFRMCKSSTQFKCGPQLPRIINHKCNSRNGPVSHHFDNITQTNSKPLFSFVEDNRTSSRSVRHNAPLPPLPANLVFDADRSMEEFLAEVEMRPLPFAIEAFLTHSIDSASAFFWQDSNGLQGLYCETLKFSCAYADGMIGNAYQARQITSGATGAEVPGFNNQVDGRFCVEKSPVMLFSLSDYTNTTIGVCLIVRPPGAAPFTKSEEDFAQWFRRKFRIFSRWIKTPRNNYDHLLDVAQVQRTEQFLQTALPKIESYFHCREAEIWKLDKESNVITCYSNNIVNVETEASGIAGACLLRASPINIFNCKMHASYNPVSDGQEAEAVLAVPITESRVNLTFCVVLRGPKNGNVFTNDDEDILKMLVPHYILALENSNSFTLADDDFQHIHMERESLTALLEVAELLGEQRDKDKLLLTIMEKGRSLTNSDRCALFIVNDDKDKLITSFQNGLANAISIPINKGIAGKTYQDKVIMNIPDAYDNEFFDSTTDKETGYRTHSILSVPIYNNRSEIIGVTEMINKEGNKPFTRWDIDVIQIFNVFAGISLENVALYKEAQDKGEQLHSLLNISFSLTKSEDVQRRLKEILRNARKTIKGECASLFLVDETNECLYSYIYDGGQLPPNIPLNSGVAATCARTKKGLINNDVYHSSHFNRSVDISTGFKTNSLLAYPVLSGDNKLIGVVEIVNKKNNDFNSKDLEIVQSFAMFAAVAIENNRLKDVANNGSADVEMSKWIMGGEKSLCGVTPNKLILTEEQQKTASQLRFFSPDFKGINHIKELFYLFNKFNILKEFKISNELFFRFIYKIRSTYNDVPYHNWMHACDVTEYVAYELCESGADKIFKPLELFAILLSCICHDANHEGFNNIYNIKAQTPFGLLFKDTSVMETHHITVSIDILADDSTNLLHALDEEQLKRMWQMVIKLILSTDMAKHFEMIKSTNALIDEGKWTLDDDENRLTAMCLLLKVGDISNVSRPFDIADKWCDILNVEFYRQGDLEKSSGIGLTSPLNDREHPDKPKSQIGFYNFVCLPLYNLVAKIFPPLVVNADSVRSNLKVWTGLAEKKKLEDEAAAAAAAAAEKEKANNENNNNVENTKNNSQ